MNQNTRINRIESFKQFADTVKNTFETLKKESPEHKVFDDMYMLTICPRGRNGGINEKLCEVFYGSSPYDQEVSIGDNLQVKYRNLFETGASLIFDLLDDGYVLVTLYLPYTERMKPLISGVILDSHINPQDLTNKKLKSYWNKLNLSMVMYSLSGTPTWIQRFRWFVWISFKQTISDRVLQEKAFCKWGKSLMEYVLTVGLSGFLIYILTILPSRNETKVESLLEKILEQSKLLNQQTDSVLILKQTSVNEDTIVRDPIIEK